MGAVLSEIGRREVEADAARGPREIRVLDRGFHTDAGLAHGAVGEPCDVKCGETGTEVDLDMDKDRVDADDGTTKYATEHDPPLGEACAAFGCGVPMESAGSRACCVHRGKNDDETRHCPGS